MPVGLHSGRVWRNSIFSLFPSLVDIYAELLLKLKLRVFLAGHSVAMVTYNVTKIIPTYSLVIGQLFDNMIVASSDKERL